MTNDSFGSVVEAEAKAQTGGSGVGEIHDSGKDTTVFDKSVLFRIEEQTQKDC